MKTSIYNYNIDINEDKKIIFNTLSKKYLVYDSEKYNLLQEVMDNINKNEYTVEELEILKKLIHNNMIVKDNCSEIDEIKYLEKNVMFGDQAYFLTIQPTLQCNFRCTYCYEEHKNVFMDDITESKLINFVKIISSKVKKLKVIWFGGEPLLEFKRIETLTRRFMEICEDNKCSYTAAITTNGYMLNDYMISKMKEYGIKSIQITLDGPKRTHDKLRPLINGEGTFDKIKENILKIMDIDISLVLRINITEDNFKYVDEVFDIIPEYKRESIALTMVNIFQSTDKWNLFEMYKKSIDKGYRYHGDFNSKLVCEQCTKNAVTVEPNGVVSPCSMASENGITFGSLTDAGDIKFLDKNLFYKFKNISPFDSEKCNTCKELPICMGGCKYSLFINKDRCVKLKKNGMSLDEKVKLQYYSDLKFDKVESL